jgi:hypothetical protein
MDSRDEQWVKWDKRIRDLVLYAVGVVGICNELFVQPHARAVNLVFLGSLLGLPLVLRSDEKRRSNNGDST